MPLGDDDFADEFVVVAVGEVPCGSLVGDDVAEVVVEDVHDLVIPDFDHAGLAECVGKGDLKVKVSPQTSFAHADPGTLSQIFGSALVLQQLPDGAVVAEQNMEECLWTNIEILVYRFVKIACGGIDHWLGRQSELRSFLELSILAKLFLKRSVNPHRRFQIGHVRSQTIWSARRAIIHWCADRYVFPAFRA